MMSYLIEAGYDVNATDDIRGRRSIGTPLQHAISAKSPTKVKFLLQRGANSRKPGGLAGSPLEMAERMGTAEILDLMK